MDAYTPGELMVANVTIGVFTIVLCLGIIIAQRNVRKPSPRKLVLIATVVVLILAQACTLVALFFMGKADYPSAAVFNVSLMVSYVLDALLGLGMLAYLTTDDFEWERGRVGKSAIVRATVAFTLICTAILVSSPWTGLVYQSSWDGHFSYSGPLSMLLWLMFVVQVVASFAVVAKKRKRNGAHVTAHLAIYLLMMCVGLALSWFVFYPLVLTYAFVAFTVLFIVVDIQAQSERQVMLKNLELSEARVQLLSNQIRPHFIFNSLLAIKELCLKDPVVASNAVQTFSEYLRSNIETMSDSRPIPFEREMDNVRHYLDLEQVDPAYPIDVQFDLREVDFAIPPLTVEPLVENAVRHGIGSRKSGGTVKISSWRQDGTYVVAVSDNGQGFASEPSRQVVHRSVGMQNVRERLALQVGGTLSIESGTGGTVATISIPERV